MERNSIAFILHKIWKLLFHKHKLPRKLQIVNYSFFFNAAHEMVIGEELEIIKLYVAIRGEKLFHKILLILVQFRIKVCGHHQKHT